MFLLPTLRSYVSKRNALFASAGTIIVQVFWLLRYLPAYTKYSISNSTRNILFDLLEIIKKIGGKQLVVLPSDHEVTLAAMVERAIQVVAQGQYVIQRVLGQRWLLSLESLSLCLPSKMI